VSEIIRKRLTEIRLDQESETASVEKPVKALKSFRGRSPKKAVSSKASFDPLLLFDCFSQTGIKYIGAKLVAFSSDLRRAFKICNHTLYLKQK
jgi:Cdc6-like AAA superfamily ATPase